MIVFALDRGKGTAFVLKSDITYKQWNMGNTTMDLKGHRPKRIFKGKILLIIGIRVWNLSIDKVLGIQKISLSLLGSFFKCFFDLSLTYLAF